MSVLVAVTLCILSTSSSSIALAQPAPQGPPPALKVVAGVDKEKGQIIFKESVIRYVTREKEVVEIVNGQAVKKVVRETVPVLEEFKTSSDIANSRVIQTDGRQLPIDEVWKRVTKGSVIAVSGDRNQPAPAYLRALDAETLVLIPGPPAPMKK